MAIHVIKLMEPNLIEQVQRVARHSCTDTATGRLRATSQSRGVSCHFTVKTKQTKYKSDMIL